MRQEGVETAPRRDSGLETTGNRLKTVTNPSEDRHGTADMAPSPRGTGWQPSQTNPSSAGAPGWACSLPPCYPATAAVTFSCLVESRLRPPELARQGLDFAAAFEGQSIDMVPIELLVRARPACPGPPARAGLCLLRDCEALGPPPDLPEDELEMLRVFARALPPSARSGLVS